jgi:hypothetical protein
MFNTKAKSLSAAKKTMKRLGGKWKIKDHMTWSSEGRYFHYVHLTRGNLYVNQFDETSFEVGTGSGNHKITSIHLAHFYGQSLYAAFEKLFDKYNNTTNKLEAILYKLEHEEYR